MSVCDRVPRLPNTVGWPLVHKLSMADQDIKTNKNLNFEIKLASIKHLMRVKIEFCWTAELSVARPWRHFHRQIVTILKHRHCFTGVALLPVGLSDGFNREPQEAPGGRFVA